MSSFGNRRSITYYTCSFEKRAYTGFDSFDPVVCASVQTLMRENRLRRYSPRHFKAIIVDEAHHALSASYQKILDYFLTAKVLGVTATPDRGDKKNLGSYFQHIAYEYSIRDAINEGYLSKILVQTIPLKIDINKVKTTRGDFALDDLGTALDPYLEEIAKHIPGDRKTLIFLPLIATSKRMAQILVRLGRKAEHIDGTILCQAINAISKGMPIPEGDLVPYRNVEPDGSVEWKKVDSYKFHPKAPKLSKYHVMQ